MDTIKLHDTGAAVTDIQQRLVLVGQLRQDQVTGTFGEETAAAVRGFCAQMGMAGFEEINSKVWAALVDASFELGDRTLYLRMPYFHGHDVLQLQQALGALGFSCGDDDGIYGPYTELALRKFQLNMGLPSDGICGAYSYAAIKNLHHSWEDKEAPSSDLHLGFARAADVLESHAICLYGTDDFARDVAIRMSNLALATNPSSKLVSADSLLVAPNQDMMLIHIALPEESTAQSAPRVTYESTKTLARRMKQALDAARAQQPARIALELPGTVWEDAGPDRSAQHFAITLLDALCTAFS